MKQTKEFVAVADAMAKLDFCMMQTVGEHGVNTRPMSNNGEVRYDGTNAPASIGKAVSHGSVRATNESVLSMAQLLMEYTGVDGASQLVQAAQSERTIKRVVDLPRHVPIRVF